jgi:hypothetical protein
VAEVTLSTYRTGPQATFRETQQAVLHDHNQSVPFETGSHFVASANEAFVSEQSLKVMFSPVVSRTRKTLTRVDVNRPRYLGVPPAASQGGPKMIQEAGRN